jgi:type I restriction enzyme R subunit
MATSDTSEKALETLIVDGLCAHGWKRGSNADYKPEFALDLEQLRAFIRETQPALEIALDLASDTPTRKKFLDRLVKEITNRGVIDVLRNGVKHGPHDVTLFYGAPSRGNAVAAAKNEANRFTVVRQLHYSVANPALSLDVCLMVNGLPVVTMELKNKLTKQSVRDAVEQYKNDRDPRELLFAFKRAMVHLAVDDQQVEFCTKLEGKASWFLPFNQGFNDGAGNPPNPAGLMTSYLWENILTREGFTDILENYAQVVEQEVRDFKTKKLRKRWAQIWPRFHQLNAVRKILADAEAHGAGKKYLIQHSAGSGKSNSIAWLVHQLVRLERESTSGHYEPIFDSVIVVTNRRILDKQINDTIKSFAQVGATVGHARKSSNLQEMILSGKKVIITTVQKFPFVVNAIGDTHRDRNFAIVIDEAHDSQSGKTAAALSKTLQTNASDDEVSSVSDDLDGGNPTLPIPDIESEEVVEDDPVQDLINAAMAGRKMATNASYFAFTATPKNKTLEMFGDAYVEDGKTKHRPFHTYTMKQAIDEGFILDTLSCYTPVESYYKLVKTVESDPEFDSKRANKKLRAFVEGHNHAIEVKAGIIVDHFLDQVIAPRKIGGEARAMVVCGSIKRAIQYYHAISKVLSDRGGQYKAIVAFSGEHDYAGKRVSESSMNGFPTGEIADRIQEDPYRILVCADKFQTGYDEPLLHTMYVDKMLSGVKAVQTLSRLNRAHPKKHDVFVLDFQNDTLTIKESFAPFYRTAILADETDANKLHDLKADLDNAGVYSSSDVDTIVERFLGGQPRQELDPVLDACAVKYGDLDEDQQVRFKGGAKAFVRSYDFLGSILPYTNADWEKLSIFLNLLIAKLPAPKGTDLAKGILDAIDMDSYRAEKKATEKILLPDENTELEPVPAGHIGGKPEAELDRLSNIIKSFNDNFGNTLWTDADRIAHVIAVDIPARVNADERYQNAKKHSDKENARAEHDRALNDAMQERMEDESELFLKFAQDPLFKEWLRRTIFEATYDTSPRE